MIKSEESTEARCKAHEVITPDLQRITSKAIRNDDTVTLINDVAICPYCGKKIPAYSEFIYGTNTFEARSSEEIASWSTYQLSLFGEEPKELYKRCAVFGASLML